MALKDGRCDMIEDIVSTCFSSLLTAKKSPHDIVVSYVIHSRIQNLFIHNTTKRLYDVVSIEFMTRDGLIKTN